MDLTANSPVSSPPTQQYMDFYSYDIITCVRLLSVLETGYSADNHYSGIPPPDGESYQITHSYFTVKNTNLHIVTFLVTMTTLQPEDTG